MKIWKGADRMLAPEERECEVFGYPNKDNTGETMNDQDFFLTEKEAWLNIIRGVEAGTSLAAREYERAQEQLHKAEQHCAEVVIELRNVQAGYRDFLAREAETVGVQR